MISVTDRDLLSRLQARQLAAKAKEASLALARFSQAQIDAVIDAMAAAADKEAENLARMAHEETGYGKVSDKILKNRLASRDVHRFIRTLKTAGVVGEDKERKIIMIAEPVGVVAAILPSTNPTSTAIYNILISVKARNAIVLSPHPAAKKCICRVVEIMREAALGAGAPEGTVCCMTDVSQEGTQELMQDRNISVILATGGAGIVRLAYSSGKPSYGVGPGNVPAFIERSALVPKAVQDIITGKTFDNGVLCSSEQSLIYEAPIRDQVMQELRKQKVYFMNDAEIAAVGKVVITPTFNVNPRIVGKSATFIAAQAGIQVPQETTVLVAPLKDVGKEYPLSVEKLSPVLALYEVPDFDSGVELCIKLVRFGGMGHTMAFHSTNQERILELGIRIPVFRVIINSPATHGSVGLTTGLDPAMTLGCGAVGGNTTSDNVSPLHLMNIKRVAFEIRTAASLSEPSGASSTTNTVVNKPNSAFSIEERVARFLDGKQLGGAQRGPESAPAAPEPAVQQLGQHKVYPLHPSEPKTGVIANPAAQIHPSNPPERPAGPPMDFVCEEDVRQALLRKQTIAIHAKTIITPSARDLASNGNVFKQVDKSK
jgi:acetaldehyde dehydrogenase (acetylating)